MFNTRNKSGISAQPCIILYLIIYAFSQELIIHAFIKALSLLSQHYSFDTSIGCHFVSFLTYISRFYIYLVKYFNLNENDSSDRIGILYQNLDRLRQFRIGSDRILNIRQLSDYKRPIRSDAHL